MKRRMFAAVLAVVALGAVACGKAPDRTVQAQASPAYLAHAADQTMADTGRYQLTVDVHATHEGKAVDGTVTATGEYDTASKSSHVTLDAGSLVQSMLSQAPPAMADSISKFLGDSDMKVQIVQVGSDVYVQMPFLSQLTSMFGRFGGSTTTPTSDSWMKLDLSKMTDLGTSGIGTTDPSVFLKLLDGTKGDVRELGSSTIRGVDTKGYAVTFTLADALARVSDAATRAKIQKLIDDTHMSKLLDIQIPLEIYVDADGLVRRVVYDFDLADVAKELPTQPGVTPPDGTMTMKVTLDFFDFGAAVNIQAPPASQVVQPPDLSKIVGSRNGLPFGQKDHN